MAADKRRSGGGCQAKRWKRRRFELVSLAMRIIAGKARGRPLKAPKGQTTRPTPDRVREAVFSILGANCSGSRVLDCFAGTGALGLEALSRGATSAVFVELSRGALSALRHNVTTVLGPDSGAATIVVGDFSRLAPTLPGPFDLVFLDPPYADGVVENALRQLLACDLVGPDGIVVCEHSTGTPLAPVAGFTQVTERSYGDVSVAVLGRD